METLAWNDAYETGVPLIDRQHRGLVRLINQLSTARRRDANLAWVLEELDLYVREHFSAEEQLMHAAGYPNLAAHREEHRAFEEWLRAVKRSSAHGRAGTSLLIETVSEYLRNWLINHILKSDMAYRPWLADAVKTARGDGARSV